MKRYLIIILTALLFCSCEGVIVYKDDVSDKKIVINALLDAQSTEHWVHVGISDVTTVDTLASGSVKMYVNGKLVSNGVKSSMNERFTYFSSYVCEASLKAGDVVRIEAVANNVYKGSAEVVVPTPAKINKVDTATVWRLDEYGDREEFLRINLNTSDVSSDDDYYYLGLNWFYYVENYAQGELIESHTTGRNAYYDYSEDMILSEEASNMSNDLFEFGSDNVCGIFSDRRFKDSSADLRVFTETYPGFLNPSRKWAYNADSMVFKGGIKVVVHHISEDYYYYLKALNSVSGTEDDSGILLEKTVIPTNIDGGIGYVGISNSDSKSIVSKDLILTRDLEDEEYD